MNRLLLVEDDELLCSTLAGILSQAGYEVLCAADGRKGLEAFRRQPADLVITDIIMPEMDGIEMLLEFVHARPQPKVIAMSGGGRLDANFYLQIAGCLGALRVLAKPFTPEELLKTVAEIMGPTQTI